MNEEREEERREEEEEDPISPRGQVASTLPGGVIPKVLFAFV